MDPWHVAHLIVLGSWGGVVAAESVLEVVGRRARPNAEVAARVHYWIDLTCELPILLLVLVTGTVLTLRVPLTTLHWVKILCGLAAVLVNLWCVVVVIRRHRRFTSATEAETAAETRRVFLAIKIGLPPALVALFLGLRFVLPG